jgi:uncharacterized protein (DUF1778 family)
MALESVTINLTEHPRSGPVQMIIRTTTEDKKAINRAARSLGIPQADFLRTAILSVTRMVLAQERGGFK